MLRQLRFALLHPAVTLRFTFGLWRKQKRRLVFRPGHQPTTRSGQILSTHFFDSADFSTPDRSEAERILAGELCLYGCQPLKIKGQIDWQRDYLSDFRWSAERFAGAINYDYPEGTDIKNAWELSRAHQLLTVAAVYQATKEEKYARYVVDTLADWIRRNPFYGGINWKVAMEVGIRAANWLLAYDLISEAQAVSKEFTAQLLGSLEEHGRFIQENLETSIRSNHYMGDLVGLFWIGSLCPSLSQAKKWQAQAKREFERETLHQFYPDGINFESSTAYHRLVLEIVGYSALLAQKLNDPFQPEALQRLQTAFKATAQLLKVNGEAPQFGDNDSGRLFILANYHQWNSLDFTPLLELSRRLFPRLKADPLADTTFPRAGLLVARRGQWQLNIEAAPLGQDGNGGHNHDDNGSFELAFSGQSLVVDPGTGCYTKSPVTRNLFRSARQHNAPQVESLVHPPPKLLFVGDNFTKSTLTSNKEGEWELLLQAESYRCRRQLQLQESGLTVTDHLLSPSQESLTVRLTLPPGLSASKHGAGFKLGKNFYLTSSDPITLEDSPYSPAYSLILPSQALLIRGKNQLSFKISTL